MEIESQITDSNAANWIVAEALSCVPFFEGDPAKISTLEPPTWLEGEMAWNTLQVSTYIHWQGVDFTIDGVHRTPHMPDTILDYNHTMQLDSHWNQEWQRTEMVDESADEVLNAWPFFLDDSRNKNLRINCISPGGIEDNQPKVFKKKYRNSCNNIGLLQPNNIVPTISFLLSEESKAINGKNIIIDDGWSL